MNDYSSFSPQPEKPKPRKRRPLIASRTCNVEFDTVIVELKKGCEVHGLTRLERDFLKRHKFAK